MSEIILKTMLRLTAKTDVGKVREHNEDNYVVCPDVSKNEWFFSDVTIEPEEGTLLVIADGMGGLNAGEIASAIAIETVQDYFRNAERKKLETNEHVKEALIECINNAQVSMLAHAKEHPETSGMGTTIVIAFIKDNILHTAWVGDSRCYVFRNNSDLYYATKDHSYVQELVDAGKITMQQAFYHPENNIITRSLGDNSNKTPKPDFCAYPLESGDKIILCSDGLSGMLQDEAILNVLCNTSNINETASSLVQAANEAGGHDNITLILTEILTVSNKPFSESFKLKKMPLACSYKQMDSGNPFQTLKPASVTESERGNENQPTVGPVQKKRKLFTIISLIVLPLLIITFILLKRYDNKKEVTDPQVKDTSSLIKIIKKRGAVSLDTSLNDTMYNTNKFRSYNQQVKVKTSGNFNKTTINRKTKEESLRVEQQAVIKGITDIKSNSDSIKVSN